ncbi:cytochrome bd-I ubiquinol oxidase subunit X [Paraburkholderia sacchari]
MWYFTWILGIGVALGFGIINVMWLDQQHVVDGADVNAERGLGPCSRNE